MRLELNRPRFQSPAASRIVVARPGVVPFHCLITVHPGGYARPVGDDRHHKGLEITTHQPSGVLPVIEAARGVFPRLRWVAALAGAVDLRLVAVHEVAGDRAEEDAAIGMSVARAHFDLNQ